MLIKPGSKSAGQLAKRVRAAHRLLRADPRPALEFFGAARTHTAERGVNRALLSLAHDGDYATAFVALQ
jgi:phosphopantetheinyl transferase (holo-ACP synthase)